MFNLFNKKKNKPILGCDTYMVNKKPDISDIEEKLIEKYGMSRDINFKIDILVFTDTHGHLGLRDDLIIEQDYDLCLTLGDVSVDDLYTIKEIIGNKPIFGVLGNHDYYNNLERRNIPNLNGKLLKCDDIKIIGVEGCTKYKNEQPGFTDEEGDLFVDKLPCADILISHDIPYGSLGVEHSRVHCGSTYLNKYLIKNNCPVILSGHNHTNTIVTMKNGTKVVETYFCNIVHIDKDNIFIEKIDLGLV